MKKNHLALACCLLASQFTFADNSNTRVKLSSIIVGPQAKDPKDDFSINATLLNSGTTLKNWQIGFYMPRNFRQTSTSNRKLAMQICETKNAKKCAKLAYQKSNFNDNDLSTVFTTILAPVTDYPLRKNTSYNISLLHNSSHGAQNVSSLPQSWFIKAQNQFIQLNTTLSDYTITDYNAQKAAQKNQQRINQNWANSTTTIAPLNVVPSPQTVTLLSNNEVFHFDKQIKIHNLADLPEPQLNLWTSALNNDLQLTAKIDDNQANNGLILQSRHKLFSDNPEAYQIEVNAKAIKIDANTPAGYFYALQTLRQLWQLHQELPKMIIQDQPRFKYRGVMLDVARHYLTVDQIKNFIDVMAAAKLNTLHLHLSDDEAFRLNLADYPQLAQVGAQRGLGQKIGAIDMMQSNLSQANEPTPSANDNYQYSYSESMVHDLINYANSRQITIIPEVDIPGHSRAMMKALPDSFYESGDTSEYAGFGDNSIPVCAYNSDTPLGKNFTRDLTNITLLTTQLFSNQSTIYAINNELSIGGDEVFKGVWNKSPSCQVAPWNKMSSLEKEHYFLDLFNNNSKVKHIKLSGWHEFVIDHRGQINAPHGVKANEVGHVWVWGTKSDAQSKAVTLANSNYPVVLAYSDTLYFDMIYNQNVTEPGFYWASKFGDTYAALSSGVQATTTQNKTQLPQNILGLEGAIWADVIPNYNQLQYMALPKLAGLSEAAWSDPAQMLNESNVATPNWHSLTHRLGCGQTGFLAYLNRAFAVSYRGYPNGINLEAPQSCESN